MGAREFASEMKQMIEGIKAEGTAAIYCDNLISYLTEVERTPEKDPSPADLERYKAELQTNIDGNKFRHEQSLEMFRSVIGAGQNAIKTMLLVNGGGAVALLAFIGHLATTAPERVPAFADCLLPFTFGALFTGLVSGGTYLAQFLFGSNQPNRIKAGNVINFIVIALGVLAYAMFVWGMFKTYGVLASGT